MRLDAVGGLGVAYSEISANKRPYLSRCTVFDLTGQQGRIRQQLFFHSKVVRLFSETDLRLAYAAPIACCPRNAVTLIWRR
jgi:hypothetical protein